MRFLPTPRDEVYFSLLADSARQVHRGASLLARMLGADHHERTTLVEEVRAAEQAASQVTHQILRRLSTSFVTPLDRHDIHALASGVDACMDHLEEAAELIVLYRVGPLPDGVSDLVGVLERCAELTADTMPRLGARGALREFWMEIDRLESTADRAYRRLLAQLFDDGADPIRVIKLKGVADALEGGADAFERLADTVEAIVLKES